MERLWVGASSRWHVRARRITVGAGAAILAASVTLVASGAPAHDNLVTARPGSTGESSGSNRTYRLRWPQRPGQTATHNLTLTSSRPRAISLRVYGIKVLRGLGISFLVACEHRGPAAVSWDWKQRGSGVRITLKMTTGKCYRPGPQVAGTYAAFTFRLS